MEREYWDLIDNIEQKFHTKLVELSKNEYIINEYKHSKVTLHIKIKDFEKNKPHEEVIIREHEEIVKALENGDRNQAYTAIWRHLSRR